MHTGVQLDCTYTGNVLLRTIKAATAAKQEEDPLLTTQLKKWQANIGSCIF